MQIPARVAASKNVARPDPRCSDLYVVADVDALLGHWPITFSCLIQRGRVFLRTDGLIVNLRVVIRDFASQ